MVGIGFSIFLFGVGAILTFAVDVSTEGFDINTVGIILMVVGVMGLLLFWSSFSLYRRRVGPVLSDERVVEERRIERDLPPDQLTTQVQPPNHGVEELAAWLGQGGSRLRQRAAPPASRQDDGSSVPFSATDAGSADSRFPDEAGRGVRLQVWLSAVVDSFWDCP